jgi:tryptophan-rich hypothetical protein
MKKPLRLAVRTLFTIVTIQAGFKSRMNRISPGKLLHSKWTHLQPQKKEKHFIITEVEYDEEHRVTRCVIQAAINRQEYAIDWRSLKDENQWLHGWQ